MLNSSVLDIAAGLIFTFLAVCLAVSASVEAIASMMQWRARTLLDGMKTLLNDPGFDGLALSLYNHALVNPHGSGTAKTAQDLKQLPSYVDPGQFADALIDVIKVLEDSPDKTRAAIDANVADGQLKLMLTGIAERAAGNFDQMRDQIAKWFDNGMDRLSGVYKRRTQIWTFALALILVAGFNVSSIEVGHALWQQPMIARTIAPVPSENLSQAIAQIASLDIPVGWSRAKLERLNAMQLLEMIAGWLITAIATLFGAPFWYDALERVVRLKGAGPSPAEKSTLSGAAV